LSRFSLPLAEGALRPGAGLSLEGPDGVRAPLQTRPLVLWRDGSVRWLDAETLVSTPGTCRIREGAAAPAPGWPRAVGVTEAADGAVTLDNGIVAVTVSPEGPGPIRSLLVRGQAVAEPGLAFEAFVRNAAGASFTTRHETARTVAVRSRGPVRAAVEIRGRPRDGEGNTCLSYRLRLELVAGAPVLTLRYWVFHDDPGIREHLLNQIGARTAWKTAAPVRRFVHQTRYSMISVPREAETDLPVDIRSGPATPLIHVEDAACWKDENTYPDFLCDPRDTKPYLGLALESGAVALHVDDFAELNPKGLTSDGSDLTLHLWPPWADELSMHQGWSREMTLRAVFFDAGCPVTAPEVEARVAGVDGTFAASIPPAWHSSHKTWLMDTVLPKGGGPAGGAMARKGDAFLTGLCGLPTVMGMWDLGDTIDPGYTTTYSYLNRLPRRPGSPPQRFQTGGAGGHYNGSVRYMQENMLHNEPVWTNNEYDVILCLARECLRGGWTPALGRKLRWFARHAVEVDFVHYSDYPEQHHGSPAHSLRHCMASAYPSHLWCEGLLMYYCLSGDDDALDVAVKMGDFIVATFTDPARRGKLWKFSRELGWALLYLASVAEMTGEKRFVDLADSIAGLFMAQELKPPLLRDMLQYSFAYASLALGMEMHQRATGRKDVGDWLVKLADNLLAEIEAGAPRGGTMSYNYFIAAWTVSGERRFLDRMPLPDDFADAFRVDDVWPHTKPVAMQYRPYSRLIHLLTAR
jgi:hypothetical protein